VALDCKTGWTCRIAHSRSAAHACEFRGGRGSRPSDHRQAVGARALQHDATLRSLGRRPAAPRVRAYRRPPRRGVGRAEIQICAGRGGANPGRENVRGELLVRPAANDKIRFRSWAPRAAQNRISELYASPLAMDGETRRFLQRLATYPAMKTDVW